MRTASQLLLTFLLNAIWQVTLIATLASLSVWLLRNSAARYRHWIWVGSLFLSAIIPLITSSEILVEAFSRPQLVQVVPSSQSYIPPINLETTSLVELSNPVIATDTFVLSNVVALCLVLVYSLVVVIATVRLLRALHLTRRLKRSVIMLPHNERVSSLLEKCSVAISGVSQPVQVCFSESVQVPITIGTFRPMIIVPKQLLNEPNDELLMSAIGHELIHVQRQDYALNLVYEVLFMFLSFHPAAALIRRRIRQTRELSCDELVAERILNADIYARSLVQLASSVPTLRRLSISTTVGIADADILEVRVMSLLKKQKLNSRGKRLLLAFVSLLLFIPSLAAASLATKFDVDQTTSQEQEQKDKEKERTKERRESREYQIGWTAAQDEKMRKGQLDEETVTLRRRHEEEELKARDIMHATLVRLARVPMEQAILIATSQYPGKVLECSLSANHWEEPGKLAKDGAVFYHVVILSTDENEPATSHVLVNAIDGTIIKSEKELQRKMRSPERP